MTATGIHGVGGGAELYGQGGSINVNAWGGTIAANTLEADASGSTGGGTFMLETGLGYDSQVGSATFGSFDVTANGGTTGGQINIRINGDWSADLGVGSLTALGSDARIDLEMGSVELSGFYAPSLGADSLTMTSDGAISIVTYGHTVLVDDFVNAFAKDGFDIENLSAGGEVDLGTFGLAQFLGTLTAPTITVTSNDIEIAGGAFLGVYGVTNLLDSQRRQRRRRLSRRLFQRVAVRRLYAR